jgi:ABC-type transport system involved in multi-copper enzyme maturation permease subunit
MKFLAILKDSLREAIDCKVLYVMVGLSCLVTLVVLSLSFKPLPAENNMRDLVSGKTAALVAMMSGEPPADFSDEEKPNRRFWEASPFELKSVRVAKGLPDAPESHYTLTISMRANQAEVARIRKEPDKVLEQLRKQFAFLEKLNLLKLARLDLLSAGNPDTAILIEVQTEPTEATRRVWQFQPSLFFGAVPLGGGDSFPPLGILLFSISRVVIYIGAWVAILTSIIITAFFIPNMLRKGTVDLMIVKPMQRWLILLYKYLGGLTFIFLNTTLAIVGIWLALGLRSGMWANSFLLMIFVITFFFAILYAVSTLFAVLTRSAIVAILMTCGAWFLFFIVGTINQVFETQRYVEKVRQVPPEKRWGDNAFGSVIKGIRTVTPRTSDLDHLGKQILLSDFLTGTTAKASILDKSSSITWGESLTVSGVFVVLTLGLACWWFATKDF